MLRMQRLARPLGRGLAGQRGFAAIASMEELAAAREGPKAVLYFTAQWCGPCRAIAPVFDKLEAEHGEGVTFAKVDIDALPDAAGLERIQSVPTFVFIEGGEAVERFSGADRDRLTASVEDLAER